MPLALCVRGDGKRSMVEWVLKELESGGKGGREVDREGVRDAIRWVGG